MIVTTSWDDGTADDVRVSELLDKYGLKGTFYVCPKTRQGKAVLTEDQIRKIARTHEIGAHTMTHPHLTKIPLDEALQEIARSKEWVEKVTGAPCIMFCYPYGDYSQEVQALVQQAGFSGARTTEALCFLHDDNFALPTTLQVRPFPWRGEYSKWWHRLDPLGPLRYRYKSLKQLGIAHSSMSSWLELAKALVQKAQKNGGHVHIWGHSSEVEKLNMWSDLEKLFQFIANESDATPAVNSALIQ